MHLPSKLWSCISYLANILSLSPEQDANQQPIGGHVTLATDAHPALVTTTADYPIFYPPGGRQKYAGSDFQCEYPDMPDYEFCGDDKEDRGCWLRPKDKSRTDLRTYNIYTDYENIKPKGIVRSYDFTVRNGTINADGLLFKDAKIVNDQYPGPWLQAVSFSIRARYKHNNILDRVCADIHSAGVTKLSSTLQTSCLSTVRLSTGMASGSLTGCTWMECLALRSVQSHPMTISYTILQHSSMVVHGITVTILSNMLMACWGR